MLKGLISKLDKRVIASVLLALIVASGIGACLHASGVVGSMTPQEAYPVYSLDGKKYHNPYHGWCTVDIVVGGELGKSYDDALGLVPHESDGYVYKVRDGETVELPHVRGLNGLHFVGWNFGGSDVEIGNDKRSIVVEKDGENDSITLYAVYVTDNGDVYCACGAYKENAMTSEQVDMYVAGDRSGVNNGAILLVGGVATVCVCGIIAKKAFARKLNYKVTLIKQSGGELK